MTEPSALSRVLIANRGEIAVRVIAACRDAGIETVAVYSEVDANALHVISADQAVCLGESEASASYLDVQKLLQAAKDSGADAVHPGYGFLSENQVFCQAVIDADLIFVGPRPETMALMGSKTAAREAMEKAGVPVLPGYQGADRSEERLRDEAEKIGYPILVKADFGGGGKGMRIVRDPAELAEAVAGARREAENAFGDGAVFLERFVDRPRHVEVQVFGDGRGGTVHLFERECSIQRRHQKIIEESPSPGINPELRKAICDAGVLAASAVEYLGAGTVEFLVDDGGDFYFLEMNTRLQVEHPVTEKTCDVDLVAAQLVVAAGGALPWEQSDLTPQGHAIECRLYAEDPREQFLPSIGTLLRYQVPEGPHFRHDGGVRAGDEVSPYYDPMLAKLIVWGADRVEAIQRMQEMLASTVVHGVKTNVSFLQHLVSTSEFASGEFHTQWVDDGVPGWGEDDAEDRSLLAAALVLSEEVSQARGKSRGDDISAFRGPWSTLVGWRLMPGGSA